LLSTYTYIFIWTYFISFHLHVFIHSLFFLLISLFSRDCEPFYFFLALLTILNEITLRFGELSNFDGKRWGGDQKMTNLSIFTVWGVPGSNSRAKRHGSLEPAAELRCVDTKSIEYENTLYFEPGKSENVVQTRR
jgi:hypothetical protein